MLQFTSKLLGCITLRSEAEIHVESELTEPGLELLHVTVSQEREQYMPRLDMGAQFPNLDIQNYWQPGAYRDKSVQVEWGPGFESKATTFAPVSCLYNIRHENRLTLSVSETVEAVRLKIGVHEEDASFSIRLRMFHVPSKPLREYSFILRVDTRKRPYYQALADVSRWWETLESCRPTEVPELARDAMYSTWYSFHQQLQAKTIEDQCRIAREFGCRSVIVDDGWQTLDAGRGYAYCGDWKICPEKMGDMAAHVARIHEIGMKYILWYSVPYVGIYSDAYRIFQDKFLYVEPKRRRGVLDPRFPEVREYLINTYEQALKQWDIDGFKLDFVDKFVFVPEVSAATKPGQDYISVQEATDRLLSDVIARLKALKPDVLIEFRQDYIGPCMRKYGNMFRVGDCPNDSLTNRMGILDLRLLSGATAVHSDMLMWNPEEAVESAALQLINILFAVPQFSMDLTKLSAEHLAMSRFWLRYLAENRQVLLDGELIPLEPENLYPLVYARRDGMQIAAVYQDRAVTLDPHCTRFDLINGAMVEKLLVRNEKNLKNIPVTVRDCMGNPVRKGVITLPAGIHELEVPRSGIISLG